MSDLAQVAAGPEADDVIVSVIIPCFNVVGFVGRTLESLIEQSHARWEAVVVDDGSTDGTAECIASFGDERIRLVQQANNGVSAARNRGIALSTGTALLFLDADDWLAPDALERMVASLVPAMRDGGTVATYGAFCFVTEDGSQIVRRKSGPFAEGDILQRLLVENLFANGGHMLISRAAATSAGSFRADLRFGEDWEYWCRLAAIGRFAVVPGPEPLLYVRQRRSGAYLRMATDPRAFEPCTGAIYDNPALSGRLDAGVLRRLRRRTKAENAWIMGREAIRHRRHLTGLRSLATSWRAHPSPKRAILLVVACLSPILPPRLAGPFRSYEA